ncbi:MAG: hypothetical protein ACLFQY_21830 [Desulfococcaceae bacterium]
MTITSSKFRPDTPPGAKKPPLDTRPRLIVLDEADVAGEEFTPANGRTVSGTITLPGTQTSTGVDADAWSWVGHLSLQAPEETLLRYQRVLFKPDR